MVRLLQEKSPQDPPSPTPPPGSRGWSAGRQKSRIASLLPWRRRFAVLALFLVLPLLFPAGLAAKLEGYPEPSPDLRFYLSGAPIYRFPTKVDGGGTLSVFSFYFSADASKQINEKLGAGLGFIYELDDYNFSGLTGFPVAHPWNTVQRIGFNVPLFYSLNDTWKLIVIPMVQFSGEWGARFGDALVYGGATGVAHTFWSEAYPWPRPGWFL